MDRLKIYAALDQIIQALAQILDALEREQETELAMGQPVEPERRVPEVPR